MLKKSINCIIIAGDILNGGIMKALYINPYGDLKGVVDTAFMEGELKGRIEEKWEIARRLKNKKLDIEIIIESTGLSREELSKL